MAATWVDARRVGGVAVRLVAAAGLLLVALAWAKVAPGEEGRRLLDLPGGRHVDERDLPALALLAGAAFLAATAVIRRAPLIRPVLAAALGAAAVWWWLIEPYHGEILWGLTPEHGFTEGDVPGAGLMAIGLVLGASACRSVVRRVSRRT